MTVLPSDTWPSPPMATTPLRRTERMVVPWKSVIQTKYMSSGPLLRARMRGIVDLGEVLKIKVRIHLRGRNIGVTEQFLHAAQILARFEQVRREGVPEHVRMHVHAEARASCPLRDS